MIYIDQENDKAFIITNDGERVYGDSLGFMYDKEVKVILKWGLFSYVGQYYNALYECKNQNPVMNDLVNDYAVFKFDENIDMNKQLNILSQILESTGLAELFIERIISKEQAI